MLTNVIILLNNIVYHASSFRLFLIFVYFVVLSWSALCYTWYINAMSWGHFGSPPVESDRVRALPWLPVDPWESSQPRHTVPAEAQCYHQWPCPTSDASDTATTRSPVEANQATLPGHADAPPSRSSPAAQASMPTWRKRMNTTVNGSPFLQAICPTW